jgi:RHS repeat-associated protein
VLLLTHRYLDPATGRFLTRDPVGFDGGINLYAYVGNAVVNKIDPWGALPMTFGNLARD